MTAFDRIERAMPELLTELAPSHVPDYFDDLLQETARSRQRPAWSSLERWLPMDIALARPTGRARPLAGTVAFLVIALLLIAIAVAFVGSQSRLPPAFGVAGNGALLYRDTAGQIVSLDPNDGSTRTVAAVAGHPGDPLPSRDGRRIAVIPYYQEASASILVMGMDGKGRLTLPGSYREVDSADWSPDGAHLAVISNVNGLQSVSVVPTDGSADRTLALDRQVAIATYLPDGRIAVVAAERPGDECPGNDPTRAPCALYVVNGDGTGLTELIPATEFHGINTIDPSADGSKLLWVQWKIGAGTTASPDEPGRLHVLDLTSGVDHKVADAAIAAPYNVNRAWLSPDGSAILFDYFEADATHWAVVPVAGGPPIRIGQAIPQNGTDAGWAPDGRSVLAYYPQTDGTSELWMLDPTGGGADRLLQAQLPYLPAWQRVAAGR
jgi:Tol biopolymer transport system component